MAYLLDTNILMRLANASDPQHHLATHAVLELHRRGEVLHVTPQVLIEFRSAATRPKSANGAGLSVADAENHAAKFEAQFPLLADRPDVFTTWKGIVAALGIISKQVYDARVIAVCHVYSVTHLLTFNVADFKRLATMGPGITVVDPGTV